MSREIMVPVKKSDWSFFDRQRTVFKSRYTKTTTTVKTSSTSTTSKSSNTGNSKALDKAASQALDVFNEPMDKTFEAEMKAFEEELNSLKSSMFKLTGDSSMLKVDKPIVEDLEGRKKLALRFDVSEFKPEEITVKAVDNRLMVEAKHSEVTPTKKVYREYTKQYILPQKIDPEKLSSILSTDGVLDIEAPAPDSLEAYKERILPMLSLDF
ncbi:alpha-crystallin A chain-like [Liolophura sinensis]|uniref:alpha-crystallin A chain-like n=1 Tax=Liolophura sinensis TaxID=3198878 RepID=UPI0031581686